MISWQEQYPWKIDTSPNALRGLTTLPRIFTRPWSQTCVSGSPFENVLKAFGVFFQSPDFILSEGKGWQGFQLSPSCYQWNNKALVLHQHGSPAGHLHQAPAARSPRCPPASLCSHQSSTEQSSHLTLRGLCNPVLAVSHHLWLPFDVCKWMLLKGTCWAERQRNFVYWGVRAGSI